MQEIAQGYVALDGIDETADAPIDQNAQLVSGPRSSRLRALTAP